MNLSKRLTHIQKLHDGASTIWDIGCDHGLLGLSFVDYSEVTSIHLVDPSGPVMDVLQNKIQDAYITTGKLIKTHLQKGQDVILGSESKTIFIAGMGGQEIIEIIEALMPQLQLYDRLIISPHRKVLELRQWLTTSELGLVSEEVVYEDGQFYPILSLAKGRMKVSPYGETLWQSEDGQRYLTHQLRFFSQHKDVASRNYVQFLHSLIY